MTSQYTNVTNYETDTNLEAITEQIVNSHTGNIDYRTIYVERGTYRGTKIPAKQLNLNANEIADAQQHANKIRNDLQSRLQLDMNEIAQLQADKNWHLKKMYEHNPAMLKKLGID